MTKGCAMTLNKGHISKVKDSAHILKIVGRVTFLCEFTNQFSLQLYSSHSVFNQFHVLSVKIPTSA